MVAASGLYYYFEEKTVLSLFRTLKKYGDVELLFDTVNGAGMKRMSKYMKQVGHSDASMYFYVDDGKALAKQVDGTLIREEAYYAHTCRRGLNPVTAISMWVSDKCRMVKMIHLALN